MQKPQKDFPYYKEYQKKFPITKDTIFVFKDDIYSDNEIPYDIMYHERIHIRQQNEYGARKWIKRYIEDDAFRLEQEIEAYRGQLNYILKETKDKEEYAHILVECATNLSSPLYGNLISYPEAIKILKI